MDIHQLSVDYGEEQDRILFRLNTSEAQELRFWVTRRMLLKAWPMFSTIVADHVLKHGDAALAPVGAMAGMDQA
ncbi:MAG: hypothetical protein ACR2I0_12055, partial [Rhodoferax sp.]